VDRDDTSPLAIIEAATALRRNEVLALLGDRDGSSHTATFNFFGRPAQIPVGAAYLALATGAPVIPVFVPLVGEFYDTFMEEPLFFRGGHADHGNAIREGTERLLLVFERFISAYPDQWYNFYDYWGGGKHKDEE
jgi:KDO2-lipid IV(A) lauroyltransferase